MRFYRILGVTAAFLALAIAGGTIYGLFFRRISPREELQPPRPPAVLGDPVEENVFSGVGRIRSLTAGNGAATVIFSIAFPYNPADRIFSEELASHIADFRAIAHRHISSHTLADLKGKSEEELKAELLREFNALLLLGRISTLYFTDYIIIE